MEKENERVIVIGAGPSGLSVAASLTNQSIPYIILERENCFASLWRKYSYDRLHLHLKKQFCELPHKPFPPSFPSYIPKEKFLQYLEDYVAHFKINPLYHRIVENAEYDEGSEKWKVKAKNKDSGEVEEYEGRFLVVASGETSDPFVPEIEGLKSFTGKVIHSNGFKNGREFKDEHVLVVGSGNSGMEIALDLINHGAKTSIVVRSKQFSLSWEVRTERVLFFGKPTKKSSVQTRQPHHRTSPPPSNCNRRDHSPPSPSSVLFKELSPSLSTNPNSCKL